MQRPEEEFYHSRFCKVLKMIDMHADARRLENAEINGEPYESKYFRPPVEVKEIRSMKEIEGFV